MILGPFPKEKISEDDGNITRTWNVWMNKVQNHTNFGQPPSPNTDVTATEGIKLTSHNMRIQSVTAGAITITANPQITPGYDGQELRLEGLDNVKTVTITNGNGLDLTGGASFTIGNNDVINLHYNKAKDLWTEDHRADN